MKNKFLKGFAGVLAAAMVVTALPVTPVAAAGKVKATKVTVKAKASTVTVGKSTTLTIKLNKKSTKNVKVTLKSSAASKVKLAKSSVTIKKGKVSATVKATAKKAGKATITASFKKANGKTAKGTCKITAKAATPAKVALTGVTLDNTTPKAGDTVNATIAPENATGVTFEWFIGDQKQTETGSSFVIPKDAKAGDAIIVQATDDSGNSKAMAAIVAGAQDESGVVITGTNFAEGTTVEGTVGVAAAGSTLTAAYTGKATNLKYQWYCSKTVDGQYVDASAHSVYTRDSATLGSVWIDANSNNAVDPGETRFATQQLADADYVYVYAVASGILEGKEVNYESGKIYIGDSVATDPAYVSTEKNYQKAVKNGAKTIVLTKNIQFKEETEIPEGITVDINGTDVTGTIKTNKGTITNTKTAKTYISSTGGGAAYLTAYTLDQKGSIDSSTDPFTNEGTITVPSKSTIQFRQNVANKGTIETAEASDPDDADNTRGHVIFGTLTAPNTATDYRPNWTGKTVANTGTITNAGEMFIPALLTNSGNGKVVNTGNVTMGVDESAKVTATNFTNTGSIKSAVLANLAFVTEKLGGSFVLEDTSANITTATDGAIGSVPDVIVKDGVTASIDINGNTVSFDTGKGFKVVGAGSLELKNSAAASKTITSPAAVVNTQLQTTTGKTAGLIIGKNVELVTTSNENAIDVVGTGLANISIDKDAKISPNGTGTYILNEVSPYTNITVADAKGYGDKWSKVPASSNYKWTASSASITANLPTAGVYGTAPVITTDSVKVKTTEGVEMKTEDAFKAGAISAEGNIKFRAVRNSDGLATTTWTGITDLTYDVDGNANNLGTHLAKLGKGTWTVTVYDTIDSDVAPYQFTYEQSAKKIEAGDFVLTYTKSVASGSVVDKSVDQGGVFTFTNGADSLLDLTNYKDVKDVKVEVQYNGVGDWVNVETIKNNAAWTLQTMSTANGASKFRVTVTMENNFVGEVIFQGDVSRITDGTADNSLTYVLTGDTGLSAEYRSN